MSPHVQIVLLFVGLVATTIASFFFGGVSINWSDLASLFSSTPDHQASIQQYVLLSVRSPRILGSIVVGATLAGGGIALQSLFRNPLADPSIIGISSGASAFAVFIISMGATSLALFGLQVGYYTLPVAAFIGALITAIIAYRMSLNNGRADMSILLLSGIALQFMAAALTSLMIFTSNDQELRNVTFWMMGSMSNITWTNITILALFVMPGFIYYPRIAGKLNKIQLGEDQAYSMGVDTQSLKRKVILVTTLGIGATVAFCGVVSFIGLVAPHIMRLWIGHNHRYLIPASLIFGGFLNLVADTLARTIVLPQELPISIITAIIGAPVFVTLIIRERKKLALAQ
ncbi:MAG: iron ABC transporter permease [Flavobacteriales bacterium]|nr:iron ABC transporter permease [Flavobacteriales bacterium]